MKPIFIPCTTAQYPTSCLVQSSPGRVILFGHAEITLTPENALALARELTFAANKELAKTAKG